MHSHFFEGVNLTGGIPLVLWVDHLGVIGITGSLLVMEGIISPVELTGRFPACRQCSLACQSWWNWLVHWQRWDLRCLEIWVEGMVKTWWKVSTAVPFSAFSFQLKIGRLRSGFDHWSSPSQYGIVRKLYPIWFRFLGWLIDCTSFPYISMHFFHKNRLSWFEFHWEMGGSTWLRFHQFFPDPECFHSLSNTGWNPRKWSSQFSACESFKGWWKVICYGCHSVLE